MQLGKGSVTQWSEPIFSAFCTGCWLLCWTADTLYWIAKPQVHVEHVPGNGRGRRLHNEKYAAVESDLENLYFVQGVLVPAFVVVRPDWITVEHVKNEENTEVRRIMVERMGWERFARESKMKVLHTDELKSRFPALQQSALVDNSDPASLDYVDGIEKAELLESEILRDFEDRPIRLVKLTCPSTGRVYVQRVAHDETRVYEAIARSFQMTEKEYKSGRYFRQGDVLMWAMDQRDDRVEQAHS